MYVYMHAPKHRNPCIHLSFGKPSTPTQQKAGKLWRERGQGWEQKLLQAKQDQITHAVEKHHSNTLH